MNSVLRRNVAPELPAIVEISVRLSCLVCTANASGLNKRLGITSFTFERLLGIASDSMAKSGFYIIVILCMVIETVTVGEQLSAKICEDLGFTGLALCSDCQALAEYVKDEEIVSDCKKCCAQESEDSISKVIYSGAILEVCMRKLVFYPDILSFIEEEGDDFSSLHVQYIYGSPPKLLMLDEDGNHKETIRIDNWKREHIRQFLKEKVRPKSVTS